MLSDIPRYKIHPPTYNGSHIQQDLRGHTSCCFTFYGTLL